MKTSTLLWILGGAVAAYFVYTKVIAPAIASAKSNNATSAANGITDAISKAGSTVSGWFNGGNNISRGSSPTSGGDGGGSVTTGDDGTSDSGND